MTTDSRTVALFRKGSRSCSRRRANGLGFVLRFFLLHCWDARVHFSGELSCLYGYCRCCNGSVQRPFRLIVALIHSYGTRFGYHRANAHDQLYRQLLSALRIRQVVLPLPDTSVPTVH